MRNRVILAVALLALAAFPAFAVNMITNPSFEDASYSANSVIYPIRTLTTAPNVLPGWTITSGSTGNNGMLVVTDTYTEGYLRADYSPVSFATPFGATHVDLGGAGNQGAQGISQTLTTVVGQSYTLSFYVGNMGIGDSAMYCDQPGSTTTNCAPGSVVDLYRQASTVNLVIDNGAPLQFTNSGDGGTSVIWQQFTHTFTATGTSTTVAFNNPASGNDNYVGLDEINMDVTPQGVPEPGTIAMMGCGLLALGMLRNRLRKNS